MDLTVEDEFDDAPEEVKEKAKEDTGGVTNWDGEVIEQGAWIEKELFSIGDF